MKVLFVCQRNNGRSQIAKGIYNKLTGTEDADGAGLNVDNHGQLLKDRAKETGSDVSKVIEVMNEIKIDVSDSPRKQFDVSRLANYDKIIFILQPKDLPGEVKGMSNVEVWAIDDPKTKDLDGVRVTRDEIKTRVEQLLV